MDSIMNEFNIGDIVYCKTYDNRPKTSQIPMRIKEKLIDGPYASKSNPSYLCVWKDSDTNEDDENWFKWNEIEK